MERGALETKLLTVTPPVVVLCAHKNSIVRRNAHLKLDGGRGRNSVTPPNGDPPSARVHRGRVVVTSKRPVHELSTEVEWL